MVISLHSSVDLAMDDQGRQEPNGSLFGLTRARGKNHTLTAAGFRISTPVVSHMSRVAIFLEGRVEKRLVAVKLPGQRLYRCRATLVVDVIAWRSWSMVREVPLLI